MTPAKRRPATSTSQGPTRAAPAAEVPTVADPPPPRRRGRLPDVPTTPPKRREGPVADVPTTPPDAPVPDDLVAAPVAAVAPVETEDGSQLLGPDGEPLAQEAPTEDAGGNSARPMETGQVSLAAPATQSRRRPGGLYPLPVWPD